MQQFRALHNEIKGGYLCVQAGCVKWILAKYESKCQQQVKLSQDYGFYIKSFLHPLVAACVFEEKKTEFQE